MKRLALILALLTVSLSAQTGPGSYVPVPAPQFFTNAGAPCAGCLLQTYASGTTTPLATYSDVGLTVANANPIVLDSAGRATIFLQKSTYKFVLQTSGGVTIWTRDTIASIAQMAASVISSTLQVVQTSSVTGTQNDFTLTANAGTLRLSNASLTTLTGLSAGYDGQVLTIYSTGAGQVDLANQNTGSTAANRIINQVTGTISLAAGSGRVVLTYDGTASRWRVIQHEQGASITATFAAGNFTGNGAMTWTVDSGDAVTCAYILRGRQLTVTLSLLTTTIGGTPNTTLSISNTAWGSLTAAKGVITPASVGDNAVAPSAVASLEIGTTVGQSNTSISVLKNANATWTASTNNTGIFGVITFEVQ